MARDKEVKGAILKTVQGLFKNDLEALSVNNVRRLVEAELKLADGFLKEGAWKGKSKEIITDEVVSTNPSRCGYDC